MLVLTTAIPEWGDREGIGPFQIVRGTCGMPQTEWNSTTAPEEGSVVYVLAEDDRGQYVIPFPVVFRDDSWWNARTGEELDTFVAGWRLADNVE